MGRGFGYQHHQYGYPNDGGTWGDSAQRYAAHQESWGSQNEFPLHKQHMHTHMHDRPPPPPTPPSSAFGGGFGVHHQESFEDGWHGSSVHRHGYPPSGAPAGKFGYGGRDKFYYSEEVEERDCSFSEERFGGSHNYGFKPYGNNFHEKPFRSHEWTSRGV